MTASEENATRALPAPAAGLRGARWAAPVPFLITGLVFASYFVQIPALKQQLDLSDGLLGVFLMLPVLSGLVARPMVVGWLAEAFGLTATLGGLLVVLAVTLGVGLRRV